MKLINEINEIELLKIKNEIINGEVVVIPTETVYGLAADATNIEAVKKIFEIKGRPADNPLIVHIANFNMINNIVDNIPEKAERLMKNFWPGPLTVILKKSKLIPSIVSGGLDTVAVRMPNHPIALKLIDFINLPLAAPSANLSGKPSPTTVEHCINDFDGKVKYIIDGGKCHVGLESTVISFERETPEIFRPGIITKEEIESVIGKVKLSSAITNKVQNNEKIFSPGLKYRHYAPEAEVIIIKSDLDRFVRFVNQINESNIGVLIFDGEGENIKDKKCFYYGEKDNALSQSQNLFAILREIDETDIKRVYARCPSDKGVGLAVYNRLIRAANFKIKTL